MAASMNALCCQKCFSVKKSLVRHISVSSFVKKGQKQSDKTVPPQEIRENDWIGPPDKISNIRQVKFFIPKGETQIEKNYRERRQAVHRWHHEFWTAHNKSFFSKKEEFLKQRLAEKEMSGDAKNKKSLTPEEMSEFYKKFLDENYRSHIKYNKEWYKKNISLLWPALQVNVIRSIAWWRNKT